MQSSTELDRRIVNEITARFQASAPYDVALNDAWERGSTRLLWKTALVHGHCSVKEFTVAYRVFNGFRL